MKHIHLDADEWAGKELLCLCKAKWLLMTKEYDMVTEPFEGRTYTLNGIIGLNRRIKRLRG